MNTALKKEYLRHKYISVDALEKAMDKHGIENRRAIENLIGSADVPVVCMLDESAVFVATDDMEVYSMPDYEDWLIKHMCNELGEGIYNMRQYVLRTSKVPGIEPHTAEYRATIRVAVHPECCEQEGVK